MICKFLDESSYYKSLYGQFSSHIMTNCPEFYKCICPDAPKKKSKKEKHPKPSPSQPKDNQPQPKVLSYNNKHLKLKSFRTAPSRLKGSEIIIYPVFMSERYDFSSNPVTYYEYPFFIHLSKVEVEGEEDGGEGYEYYKLDMFVELSSPYQLEDYQLNIPHLNLMKMLPLRCSLRPNTTITNSIDPNTSRSIAIPLHCSVACLNNSLWVIFGGIFRDKFSSDIIIIYKDDLGIIRVIKPEIEGLAPLPRADAGMCRYKDKIYVHGGRDSTDILDDLFSIEVLRPEYDTEKWRAIITHHICHGLPKRYNHQLLNCEEKLYILGGLEKRAGDARIIYVLDPNTLICNEFTYIGIDLPYNYEPKFYTNAIVKGPLIIMNTPQLHPEYPSELKEDSRHNQGVYMWVLNTRSGHASGIHSIDPDSSPDIRYGAVNKIYNLPGNYFMEIDYIPWVEHRVFLKRFDFGFLYDCTPVPIVCDSIVTLLDALFQQRIASDITINTNNGKLSCHSLILGLRKGETSKLISMVDDDNKITIPDDIPFEIIHSAIHYLYTDNISLPQPDYFPRLIKTNSSSSKIYRDKYQYLDDFMHFAEKYKMHILHQWLDLIIKFDCSSIGINRLNLLNDLKDLYTISELSTGIELEKSSSIGAQYSIEFTKPDLIVECSDGILAVHKGLMIVRSSFCRGMLLFGSDDRFDLTNYYMDIVKIMLKYVYYDCQEFPSNRLIDLLQLSKQLGIEGLSLIVEGKLSNILSENNLVDIADISYTVNATHLLDYIRDFVTKLGHKSQIKICLSQLKSVNPEIGNELLELYTLSMKTVDFPVFLYDGIEDKDEKMDLYIINNPLPQIQDPPPKWLANKILSPEIDSLKSDLNAYKDTTSQLNISRHIHKGGNQDTLQKREISLVKRNRFEMLEEDEEIDWQE